MTRKRPSQDLEQSPKAKKEKSENDFDGLKFKLMLQDASLAFEGLSKFVAQSEIWNQSKSTSDIVAEYLKASDNCSEILQLMDGEIKRKSNELTLIFRVLHAILVRIADDLTKYASNTKTIAKHVLTKSMGCVYFLLNATNRSGQIKSALKLLTAIVMQDDNLAREVLMQFDFQHRSLLALMSRRDFKDEEDVRTCLVSFYLSFIIHGDISTIRQFLQMKGVFNAVFMNISTDHASLLEILLPTILEKIVKEPGINKTLKLCLFDAKTLDHLASLYDWKGPTRWKGKNDSSVEVDLSEEKETIAALVHPLLMELCCSHKHGINFFDKTLGLSGKNHNPVLSTFITAVKLPDDKPLLADLIMNILLACPDLIGRYFTSIQHEFQPRFTAQWLHKMDFIHKLYRSMPAVPNILKQNSLASAAISIVMVTLAPPAIIANSLLNAVKDRRCANIRHIVLREVCSVLERLASIEVYCQTEYGEKGKRFISLLKEAIVKVLPDLRAVTSCWYFLMNPVVDKKKSKTEPDTAREPEAFSPVQMYSRILDTVRRYQTTLTEFHADQTVDLAMLIDGVQKCADDVGSSSDADVSQLYHDLLRVLATMDRRTIPWGKKNKAGHSLIYLILNISTMTAHDRTLSRSTLDLICKLLCTTGLFEYNKNELMLWLRRLPMLPQSSHAQVLTFLTKVLTVLMANSQTYFDQVMEANRTSAVNDVAMETDDVGSGGGTSCPAEIEAIFSMDLDELRDNLRTSQPRSSADLSDVTRVPISSMVAVSLKVISQLDDKHEVESYLMEVLHDVLHSQTDARTLVKLLEERSTDSIADGDFLPYAKSFADPSVQPYRKPGVALSADFHQSLKHCWLSGMTALADDGVVNALRQAVSAGQSTFAKDDATIIDGQSVLLMLSHVMLCLQGLLHMQNFPNDIVMTRVFDLIGRIIASGGHAVELYAFILRHPIVRDNFLVANRTRNIDKHVATILSKVPGDVVDRVRVHVALYVARLLATQCGDKELLATLLRFAATDKIVELSQKPLRNRDVACTIMTFLVESGQESALTFATVANACDTMDDESVAVVTKLVKKSPLYALCVNKKTVASFFKKPTAMNMALVSELVRHNAAIAKMAGKCLKSLCAGAKPGDLVYVAAARAFVNVTKVPSLTAAIIPAYVSSLTEGFYNNSLSDDQFVTLCEFFETRAEPEQSIAIDRLRKHLSSGQAVTERFAPFATRLWRHAADENKVTILASLMESTILIADKIKPSTSSEEMFKAVCITLDKYKVDQIVVTSLREALKKHWKRTVRTILKHHLESCAALEILSRLVTLIYPDPATQPTVVECQQMLTSHSKFVDIVMQTTGNKTKESLVGLLLTLCRLDAQCCHQSMVSVLLGAYTATQHQTDQKILLLLSYYERNGVDFSNYKPYLWGQAGLEYISMRKNLGPTLSNAATGDEVLAVLDADQMKRSSFHFPLHRKLNCEAVEEITCEDVIEENGCLYDPRFLMPLFNHLLQSDSVLNCRDFVERGCLSYLLTSLSSHDQQMRGAAYNNVGRLLEKLGGVRFRERPLLNNFLDVIKNTIYEPNMRLPVVTTVFLAKSSLLILDADDHMYSPINSFLLLKPTMDFSDIPEFYKLFNSYTFEHKIERSWMLALLADGLRELDEYAIYQQRHAFRLITCFHDSVLSDQRAKCDVIKVMTSAVAVPPIAQRLVKNHGLLPWIAAAVKHCVSDKHLSMLVTMAGRMWTSLSSGVATGVKLPALVIGATFAICKDLIEKLSEGMETSVFQAIVRMTASIILRAESHNHQKLTFNSICFLSDSNLIKLVRLYASFSAKLDGSFTIRDIVRIMTQSQIPGSWNTTKELWNFSVELVNNHSCDDLTSQIVDYFKAIVITYTQLFLEDPGNLVSQFISLAFRVRKYSPECELSVAKCLEKLTDESLSSAAWHGEEIKNTYQCLLRNDCLETKFVLYGLYWLRCVSPTSVLHQTLSTPKK